MLKSPVGKRHRASKDARLATGYVAEFAGPISRAPAGRKTGDAAEKDIAAETATTVSAAITT
jgi:hypothetical protein